MIEEEIGVRGGEMSVLKGYKFRIYPDEKQKKFFIETFGCVRFTYNHLLMARHTGTARNTTLTPASLNKEYPFLKKTDSLALANAQRNLERAFRNYFSGRAGYPKLKTKKSTWQSYTTNNQQRTVYLEGEYLKVPKLKSLVPIHLHREVRGTIKSVTISAKRNREFYASILCVEEVEELPKTNDLVGISYCPENLIQISAKKELPQIDKSHLVKQLGKEHKNLRLRAKDAKKRKVRLIHAKNYQKQKERVLKLRATKLDQKRNFIDQLTINLVRDFDYLFIESKPKFKNETGEFSEADWQQFIQRIQYKGRWYGKEIRYIEVKELKNEKCKEIERLGRAQLT